MQTDINTDPVAAIDTPPSTPDLQDDVQIVGTTTPDALHPNNASSSDVLIDDGADDSDSDYADDYITDDNERPDTTAGTVAGLRDSATSLAEEWLVTAREFIREKPVATLTTALAVGWLLGKIRRD